MSECMKEEEVKTMNEDKYEKGIWKEVCMSWDGNLESTWSIIIVS